MAFTVEIPDDIVQALHLPANEVQREVQKELALTYYSRGLLSLGKAVEMTGLTLRDFEAILAERHIQRPYNMAELDRDLAWGKKKG